MLFSALRASKQGRLRSGSSTLLHFLSGSASKPHLMRWASLVETGGMGACSRLRIVRLPAAVILLRVVRSASA